MGRHGGELLDVHHPIRPVGHKGRLVADGEHAARVVAQGLAQGGLGGGIQVGGRLIQYQQMSGLQRQSAQLDPGLLAAAQGTDGLDGQLAADAKARQLLAGPLVTSPGATALTRASGVAAGSGQCSACSK